MRAAIIGVLLAGAMGICAPAGAESLHFHARLSGAAETPPVASPAEGLAEASLDTDTGALTWRVAWRGLTVPVLAAHIKAPPEPASALGGAMNLPGPVRSPMAGVAHLSDVEIGDLRAGLWSLHLTTARHPGGEIGGDLERTP